MRSNDLSQLSAREQEIVDFAVEGMTDQQIANAMGISVSTVNSYWVRIRGKVGQQSRTELVGRVLREQAILREEVLRLRGEELEEKLEQAQRFAPMFDAGEGMARAALEAIPDGLIVTDPRGKILFINRRIEMLLGFAYPALIETNLKELLPSRGSPDVWPDLSTCLGEVGRSSMIGMHQAAYFLDAASRPIRVLLSINSFPHGEGHVVSIIVRTFGDDLTQRRAHLRATVRDLVTRAPGSA